MIVFLHTCSICLFNYRSSLAVSVGCGLLSLWGLLPAPTFAQRIDNNPAVMGASLSPAPLEKQDSPFTISFTLGNAGAGGAISGESEQQRMGFVIELSQCKPVQPAEKALSGKALDWFDVRYDAERNLFEGHQKEGISINILQLAPLTIAAVVTQTTNTTAINTIGARCRILPPVSALPTQLIRDDVRYVYTYTLTSEKVGELSNFLVRGQGDGTVWVGWTAGLERTGATYLIERSLDGSRYEAIDKLAEEAALAATVRSFQWVDKNPVRGTSYYRLRQLGADQRELTQRTQQLVVGRQYEVTPTKEGNSYSVSVTLDEPQSAVLHLYTFAGDELVADRRVTGESSLQLTSDKPLSRGGYILMVKERGDTRQHRFFLP